MTALTVHARATYTRQMTSILVAMHAKGIVMLDFKFSNLMFNRDGLIVLRVVDADSWRLAPGPGSPGLIGTITGGSAPMLPDITPVYTAAKEYEL